MIFMLRDMIKYVNVINSIFYFNLCGLVCLLLILVDTFKYDDACNANFFVINQAMRVLIHRMFSSIFLKFRTLLLDHFSQKHHKTHYYKISWNS